jgi:septal ring factor EnvC (AmiA/AmiB activator)
MATPEECIETLEHENATRTKAEELLTVLTRAFVPREALQTVQNSMARSQKRNEKWFDALNDQIAFTCERLEDLQSQSLKLEKKIAGLQTEARHSLAALQRELRQQSSEQDGKMIGLQTETRQRFTALETMFTQTPER